MKRLVGLMKSTPDANKAQQPTPPSERGLDDIVQSANRKADVLDSQIAQCDTELRKLNQQMKNVPAGISKQSLQTKAKSILIRKKKYEQQAEDMREKSFNMDSLAMSMNAADDIKILTGVMKSGTKELKKQLKKVDLDKVEDLQDEVKDLIDFTEDVQSAMSKNYDVPVDIDDDELNTQLELLGDEIAQDNDSSYIDSALKPTSAAGTGPGTPSFKGGSAPGAATTTEVDEFGLPILSLDNVLGASKVPTVPGESHSDHQTNLK